MGWVGGTMDKPVVLYINHRNPHCGVQQFGRKMYDVLETTQRYTTHYIDIESEGEQNHWITALNPQIIVWNYYTNATMPWMRPEIVDAQRAKGVKTVCLFHEVPIGLPFDMILHQDPTAPREGNIRPLSRPIPVFNEYVEPTPFVSVGSFGFGLGGKGFDKIVEKVNNEFDTATIRLVIPFAAFGDAHGDGARSWISHCRAKITKPGITLDVRHDLLPETDLIRWLASNTINCFFYDENYGRGISGTVDYAIAAKRPFAITKSYQFQHIWKYNDTPVIGDRSLQQMIDQPTDYIDYFAELWSRNKLRDDFEAAFKELLHD